MGKGLKEYKCQGQVLTTGGTMGCPIGPSIGTDEWECESVFIRHYAIAG